MYRATQNTVFQADVLDDLPDSQVTEQGAEDGFECVVLNPDETASADAYEVLLILAFSAQPATLKPKFFSGFTEPAQSWITFLSKSGQKA